MLIQTELSKNVLNISVNLGFFHFPSIIDCHNNLISRLNWLFCGSSFKDRGDTETPNFRPNKARGKYIFKCLSPLPLSSTTLLYFTTRFLGTFNTIVTIVHKVFETNDNYVSNLEREIKLATEIYNNYKAAQILKKL
jgi:hypothetical protein